MPQTANPFRIHSERSLPFVGFFLRFLVGVGANLSASFLGANIYILTDPASFFHSKILSSVILALP